MRYWTSILRAAMYVAARRRWGMSRQIRTKEILSLMDAGFSRALIEKMQHMSKTSVLVLFEAADRLGMSWKGSSMPTQSLCRHPLYRHAGFQGGDFSLEFVGSSVYLPTVKPLHGHCPLARWLCFRARHAFTCELKCCVEPMVCLFAMRGQQGMASIRVVGHLMLVFLTG